MYRKPSTAGVLSNYAQYRGCRVAKAIADGPYPLNSCLVALDSLSRTRERVGVRVRKVCYREPGLPPHPPLSPLYGGEGKEEMFTLKNWGSAS